MPSVTVAGSNNQVFRIDYKTGESSGYAQSLAAEINAKVAAGGISTSVYTGGRTAPGPVSGSGGQVIFQGGTDGGVLIPDTVSIVVDTNNGADSIFGGAAVERVLAGNGFLTYVSGATVGHETVVAGDGANYIVTAQTGGGAYDFTTGAGNDVVGVFTGNATVNAGSGLNKVQLGTGDSLVYSVGGDSIIGNTVPGGGGTDTVHVLSGQVTINPGSSNFFVYGNDSNPVNLLAGTGSDTVALGVGGGTVFAGMGGHSLLIGGLNAVGTTCVLVGAATGDRMYAIGYGNVIAVAGAGDETISGAGGSPFGGGVAHGNNVFTAGSGNDTLLAGAGRDTLVAGTGRAVLVAGTGADEFFFRNQAAGGSDTITGFKAGTDTLLLAGYGLTPDAAAAASRQVGGGTVLTLADGTTITISGVALTASSIRTG